jgi:predicted ribosome-associated RNA-binding protein Tma20
MRLANSDTLPGIRTLLRRQSLLASPSLKTMDLPPPVVDAGRYTFNPTLKWDPDVEAYFSRAYGADHFSRISSALTRPSCYSSIRVNTLKTSTEDVKKKLINFLHETDFAKEDSTSCITQNPALENVLYVWGTGPHEISYDRQADEPLKEVIVSRKCGEAVLRGAQIYVPGVMACSSHVEEGDKVAVSVAIEKPTDTGGWAIGITRGTVLHGIPSES